MEPGFYLQPRGRFPSYHIEEQDDENYNIKDNASENAKGRWMTGKLIRHVRQKYVQT